jgi:hypothetical protein
MAKVGDDSSELVRAAETIEADLARLEELSAAACKMKLHTEKSIVRAAQALSEALEQPAKLADGLKLFGEAMLHTQARQEAALGPLAARAVEIRDRGEKLAAHMQAFAALGVRANDATKLLQASGAESTNGGSPNVTEETFAEVDRLLSEIVEQGRTLSEAAKVDEMPEVARDADALKQRIQSIRGKLKTARSEQLKASTRG